MTSDELIANGTKRHAFDARASISPVGSALFSGLQAEIRELLIAGLGNTPRPERVKIVDLTWSSSPRVDGENSGHTLQLAAAGDRLPPIIVHRETRQVIDGLHRVRAAQINGLVELDAYYFDGPCDAAFIVAVIANSRRGLPLSTPDRAAAAKTILTTHGHWSDRAVAEVTGLSAKKIREVRRATADGPQLHSRLGRDGRRRPLSAASGRRAAAEYLGAYPDSSLRTVARAAGISTGTVRDVRDRLLRGEDPVPGVPPAANRSYDPVDPKSVGAFSPALPRARDTLDVARILNALSKDPALRMTDSGRDLLRWLHQHAVSPADAANVAESVPYHAKGKLAEFAQGCAINWATLANQLGTRNS